MTTQKNMHSSTKTKLLLLLENEDQSAAIRAVLLSGLLPEPLLQKFLDNLTERAVRRVLAPPGCPEWTGRASWDAWAVKWLHSKDRSSIALVETTERIIDATTREAQQVARNDAANAAALIWAAADAARASHREPGEPLRHHALKASWAAIRSVQSAAVAAYGFCSTGVVAEAFKAEREQQYQDLMSVINSLPNERRKRRALAGNCIDCGVEISLPVGAGRPRERCETCARVRKFSLTVEWRKRKALAGKCTVCGKRAPLAGRLLCESCSDRRNASVRRIQRQHRADGRCKCGATPQEGYKTCAKCLKALAERYRMKVLTGE